MGDGLDEAVKQAELSLVLNKFKEAEHLSKEVLRKTIYDPGEAMGSWGWGVGTSRGGRELAGSKYAMSPA